MKKILSILSAATIITSGACGVVACGNDNILDNILDKFNLGTWGETQKKLIATSIIVDAKTFVNQQPEPKKALWGLWNGFTKTGVPSKTDPYKNAINKAFQKINISIEDVHLFPPSGNIVFVSLYSSQDKTIPPNFPNPVSKIFSDGFYLVVEGIRNPVTPFKPVYGQIRVHIQAKIT